MSTKLAQTKMNKTAVMSTLHIVVSEAGPIIPSDHSRLTENDGWLVRMVDDEELILVGQHFFLV